VHEEQHVLAGAVAPAIVGETQAVVRVRRAVVGQVEEGAVAEHDPREPPRRELAGGGAPWSADGACSDAVREGREAAEDEEQEIIWQVRPRRVFRHRD
jgi:hypothetical protein